MRKCVAVFVPSGGRIVELMDDVVLWELFGVAVDLVVVVLRRLAGGGLMARFMNLPCRFIELYSHLRSSIIVCDVMYHCVY